MAIVNLSIIIFLVAVVIGLIIYFFVYKRNINRKLQEMNSAAEWGKNNTQEFENGENAGKTISDFAEEPERKRMPALNTVALIVVIITCVFCVITVNSQISNLYISLQDIQNQISGLNLNPANTSSSDFPILSAELKYGAFYKEDHTADVTIEILPEEILPGTKIFCRYFGKEIELEEKENGIYTGTVRVDVLNPLPGDESSARIICTIQTEDGTKKMEDLSGEFIGYDEYDYYELRSRYLMNMGINCERRLKYKKDKAQVSLNGTLTVNDGFSNNKFEKLTLYVRNNGNVVDQRELEYSTSTWDYDFDLKESYQIGEGSENLEVSLEGIDSYGYRYVYILLNPTDENDINGNVQIYDTNGEIIAHGWW